MDSIIAERPCKKTRNIGFLVFALPFFVLLSANFLTKITFTYLFFSFIWLCFGNLWEHKIGKQELYEYMSLKNGVLKTKPEMWLNSISTPVEGIGLVAISQNKSIGSPLEMSIYYKNGKCQRFPIKKSMACKVEELVSSAGISVINYGRNT